MFFIIKSTISFTVSFLILSFPVGENKRVFDYINDFVGPYTEKIYSSVSGLLESGIRETSQIGKSLIGNTSPTLDKVISNSSAINKGRNQAKLPKDKYTPRERAALLKVLGSSSL